MGKGACKPDSSTKYRLGIGEKHSAQLMGERACQLDIFTTYRLRCELGYGTRPIVLCAL